MLLVQAGPHENLKEVALKILEHGVSTVPIIYSASKDGSYPQLLHLASLSEILKCNVGVTFSSNFDVCLLCLLSLLGPH